MAHVIKAWSQLGAIGRWWKPLWIGAWWEVLGLFGVSLKWTVEYRSPLSLPVSLCFLAAMSSLLPDIMFCLTTAPKAMGPIKYVLQPLTVSPNKPSLFRSWLPQPGYFVTVMKSQLTYPLWYRLVLLGLVCTRHRTYCFMHITFIKLVSQLPYKISISIACKQKS
jgi:hypothetical protein